MTINPAYIIHSKTPPNGTLQLTQKSGMLTGYALSMLKQTHGAVNGQVPTYTCEATGTNAILLTPVIPSPLLQNYVSYSGYSFVAENTSTSAVTAAVVSSSGQTLPALPIYTNGGFSAAGAGSIQAGYFHQIYFVDSLNSGDGGFVLIGGSVGQPSAWNCTTGGTTNAIVLTPTNSPVPPAYSDLQTYRFIATATSTGAVTIKVGSLAALSVFDNTGGSVGVGGIIDTLAYEVIYSGTLGGFSLK